MVQLQGSEACSKKRASLHLFVLLYFCFLRMCLALKMNSRALTLRVAGEGCREAKRSKSHCHQMQTNHASLHF